MPELLTIEELPTGFEYPKLFVRVVELGLTSLEPWWVLNGDVLRRRFVGLRNRYPKRTLVPFAGRQDNDDVACWDGDSSSGVFVVHDFASPGWEDTARFDTFEAWFRAAIEDFIDWE